VKHRVRLNEHRDRISIGYFVFPKEDSVIQSANYKPFTYGDFQAQVHQDVKTLGFKVGLERFKLT
jgi:isopenicillin N synthase-like dioxygenase